MPPGKMDARSTARVKKSEYGEVVFRQFLQGFKDYQITEDEKEKLLNFLKEQHEKKICKRRAKLGTSVCTMPQDLAQD